VFDHQAGETDDATLFIHGRTETNTAKCWLVTFVDDTSSNQSCPNYVSLMSRIDIVLGQAVLVMLSKHSRFCFFSLSHGNIHKTATSFYHQGSLHITNMC
jgi:hypothetical protein